MSDVVFYRFQPDAMDEEMLRRLFMGRNRKNLLSKLRKEIENAVKNQTPRYYLIIGPRGVGKTHFITLLYYDVIERIENALSIKLSEEEFSLYRVSDLLLRILRLMDERERNFSEFERMSDDEVVVAALEKLKSKGKIIVLFLENLNQILGEQMDKREVQRLRSIFQTENIFTVVTTAPLMFPEVSEHEAPFFNFFEYIHLDELTRDELKELVKEIATIENDESFLSKMDEYAQKINAVYILTGGSPRMAILLYELMSKGNIMDVEKAFFKLLDENTPYYQDIFRLLSGEKRKVFDTLIEIGKPATPKEIAEKARLDNKTVNTLLRRLEKDGYVLSRRMGKTTNYEVRERLFRLWRELRRQPFAMKKLSILVEFLELWYSVEERREKFLELFKGLREALDKTREREAGYWFLSLTKEYKKELIPQVVEEIYEGRKAKLLDELIYGDRELKAEAIETEIRILLEKKKYEKLLNKAEEMITLEKNNAFAWGIKGIVLINLKKYEVALQALSRSIEIDPEFDFAWSHKGVALGMLGRLEDALQALSKATSLNPEDASTWYVKGITLAGLGRLEEALQAFSKSAEISPKDPAVWFKKAASLTQLGRFEEALAALTEAINLNPMDSTFWYEKGKVLESLKRPEEAFEVFSKSIELNPENADVWLEKGASLGISGRYEEALEAFSKSIELNPENADVWLGQGVSLEALKRPEEALEAFSKGIELDPEYFLAWLVKGRLLEELERNEEAVEAFSKAVELNPENAEAWYYKGLALEELERNEEAVEAFSKAVELNPENTFAWACKGLALVSLDKIEEALEAFSRPIKLYPESADTWYFKGVLHLVTSTLEFINKNYGRALEDQNSAMIAFDSFSTFLKDERKANKIINESFMATLKKLIDAKNLEAVDMALEAIGKTKDEFKDFFEPISIAVEIVKSKDVNKFYELQVERREVVAEIVKKLTGSEELLPEEYRNR
jgi:tetratricopeptide (TPR) repeat protein